MTSWSLGEYETLKNDQIYEMKSYSQRFKGRKQTRFCRNKCERYWEDGGYHDKTWACHRWKDNNPCNYCTSDVFCSKKDKVTGAIVTTFMKQKRNDKKV